MLPSLIDPTHSAALCCGAPALHFLCALDCAPWTLKTKYLQLELPFCPGGKMRFPQRNFLMRATAVGHSSSSMDSPSSAFEVLVVGGGILGLSTALTIRERRPE